MSQQINLYQPIFRKEKIVFSAQTITWLSLGLVVLLALWSLLVSQRISSLEAELQRQQQAEQRAVEQVAALQSNMPPDEPDPQLEARVAQLQDRKEGLQASLSALEQRMPAADIALRERLDALATEVPDGLWLTGVMLGDRGETLRVDGNALEARLVPEWLSRLSEAPEFSGTGFRQVRLNARPDGQPGVQFSISTAPGETP